MPHERFPKSEARDEFHSGRWSFEASPEEAEKAVAEIAARLAEKGWSDEQIDEITSSARKTIENAMRHAAPAGRQISAELSIVNETGYNEMAEITVLYPGAALRQEAQQQIAMESSIPVEFVPGKDEVILSAKKERRREAA